MQNPSFHAVTISLFYDLAAAVLYRNLGVYAHSASDIVIMSSLEQPRWRAPPGCPEHIRFVLEKAVNTYPSEWLEKPILGEVFSSLEECQNRLIAYSLSQEFDIVISHST